MSGIEIVSIILNFILASGVIGYLFFYDSKKKKEAAGAAISEVEVKSAEHGLRHDEFTLDKDKFDNFQRRLSDAYDEIEKTRKLVNELRNEVIQLIMGSKDLEVQLIEERSKTKRLINQLIKLGVEPEI